MHSSDKQASQAESDLAPPTPFAREAGLPFQPPLASSGGLDPFTEWLNLMEVVQMLCPVWPVRDKPMQGEQWRL